MATDGPVLRITGPSDRFDEFADGLTDVGVAENQNLDDFIEVIGGEAEKQRRGRHPGAMKETDQLETAVFSEEFVKKTARLCKGIGEYGCSHYRRRCKIRAPCCDEVFACRHCHNEAKNADDVPPGKRHDIARHKVQSVICSLCDTEQEVQQVCKKCGVCMGKFFCPVCKFYDDDTTKQQYHCDACGICRIGGRDKFFHCNKCGCCYAVALKTQGHPCIENSMHHNCPVCFEYLFDSIRDITVMPCGHTMHLDCCKEMRSHGQYACPMCSKSMYDMSSLWAKLDEEVALTPMPEVYRDKKVWILCNDCGITGEVAFHVVAQKCLHCKSYNTRTIKGAPSGLEGGS